MKRIKTILLAIAVSAVATPTLMTVPAVAGAPAANNCTDSRFLTMPAWHRGLVTGTTGDCKIKEINDSGDTGTVTLTSFIWTVVLNVIEMGLHAVGYIAAFFIIYGGFQFFMASGSPDGLAKAIKTITNAVIGLIISIASIGVVNLIMGIIS